MSEDKDAKPSVPGAKLFKSEVSRRDFLRLAGVAALETFLASCGISKTTASSETATTPPTTEPPRPAMDAQPNVPATGEGGKGEEPWKGSSKVEVKFGGRSEGGLGLIPVSEETPLPNSQERDIIEAGRSGRIIDALGRPIVLGAEAGSAMLVRYKNERDDQFWNAVWVEGGVMLPTNYVRHDGSKQSILVYLPTNEDVRDFPDYGLAFQVKDPNYGSVYANIFRNGQVPEILAGRAVNIKPEPFLPAVVLLRGATEAPESWRAAYYVEHETEGKRTYEKKFWDYNPSTAGHAIAPLPKDIAVQQRGDKWLLVTYHDEKGSEVVAYAPVKSNLQIIGDVRKTMVLNAIPEELQKQVAAEEGKVEKRYSEFYQTAFAREMEADVDGIKVKVTIGLMSNITERAAEPVTYFEPSNQAAVNEVGRFWLKMCAYNYMVNHSEFGNPEEGSNFDNFFPKYEEMVKKGEGKIKIAAVDETTAKTKDKRELLECSPTETILIFNDSQLPVVLTQKGSVYLGRGTGGRLIIASNQLSYYDFKNQDNFANTPEERLKLRESVFTMNVAASLDIIASGINELLLGGGYAGTGVEFGRPPKVLNLRERYKNQKRATPENTFFFIQQ